MKLYINILLKTFLLCAVIVVQEVQAGNKRFIEAGIEDSIDITVSARVKIDGKIENGIHTFELRCSHNFCSLGITSINECVLDESGNSSFTTFYHNFTTDRGNLGITKIADNRYRLAIYEWTDSGPSAHINFTVVPVSDRYKAITVVTAFEATGFTNYKAGATPGATVEYVPITSSEYYVTMNCPLKVKGIKSEEIDAEQLKLINTKAISKEEAP